MPKISGGGGAPSGPAGGDLSGTYPNPTVAAAHSGSAHHADSHSHASHTGIGASDHHSNANDHAQSHSHASHTGIGASDHHPRTEAKVGGTANPASVTWTTAFASTPVVAASGDISGANTTCETVTARSTTGASVKTEDDTGVALSVSKFIMAQEAT